MSARALLEDVVIQIADRILEELLKPPWSRGRWYADHSRQRIMIQTAEGDIVAIVGQSQVGKSKAKANARLIETAPQLYQALDNLMVSAYDVDDGDCLVCGAQCAWGAGAHDPGCEVAVAAAILALARGEAR